MSPEYQHLDKLRQQLSARHPIDEAAWADFSAIWIPVKYKRKSIITVAGETEKYLYWVTSGVQRGFHLHGDKEATIVFSYPYSFSGIIDSFLNQQPSRYFLETLTASSFLKTSYLQFEQVRKKWPDIAEVVYLFLAATVSGILERQIELMVYTAEEKFRILLKRSPHILNLIPHKYLASYLGIDPTTFSKLLSSIKI
jgi:CRP-like cAMP-binding protein